MTGGRLLVESLIAQGVKAIFGIPGNQLTPVYEAFYHTQDRIRHVLARHEGSAAFMADGYARSTGEVGVCMTIPGPGASNAHIGLGEASTDCVPVLLITSQNDSRLAGHDPTKMFHGLDQAAAFSPVTKAIEIVRRADQIPGAVTRLFAALRGGRPRPAFLEVASDALAAEVDLSPPPFVEGDWPPLPDLDPLQALLDAAERPALLAGAGVHHTGAYRELQMLAERLHAPVLTSILGKGTFPETHPLNVGRSRSGTAQEVLESTDLLLAIGTRFTQMDTGNWSMRLPEPWVHIEADPAEVGKEYEPTLGIAGNPQSVLHAMLQFPLKSAGPAWRAKIASWHAEWGSAGAPSIIRVLQEVLPPEVILSVDVHITGYAMHRHFPAPSPRAFLYPGIYIAMGYGLPAAIGAKVAHPDRPVVAMAGDGSFLMNGMELATLVRHDLPVVMLISNDNSLTSIRHSQETRFGATLGVELTNPDFVAYAGSFGIDAERIRSPEDLRPAMQRALAAGVPYLIEWESRP